MGLFAAFLRGLALAVRKSKVVLFLYIVNLLFSLALAIPVVDMLASDLAYSTDAAAVENAFDLRVAVDLLAGDASAWDALGRVLATGALLYVLISTFVSGGLLECLHHRNERTSLAFFFLGCGRYVFRFLRLLVLAAVGILVLVGVNALVNHGFVVLFRDWSNERVVQVLLWIKAGGMGLVFLLFLMLLNYTRIRIVVEGRRSALGAMIGALQFFVRCPLKTTGLYALFLILGWGLFAASLHLTNSVLDRGELFGLLALQQGYLLVRMGVRVAAYGAQIELFKSLGVAHVQPPPIPATGVAPSPEPKPPEPIPLSDVQPQPPDVPGPADG